MRPRGAEEPGKRWVRRDRKGAEAAMELNEQVGRRLRQLREERGLSLSALARGSGTGKATLSELEAGRRNPTLETLYALTTALGLPLSAVLTDPGPHGPAGTHPAPGPAGTIPPGESGGSGGLVGSGGAAGPGVSGAAVTAVLVERYEDAGGGASTGAVTDVFRIRIASGARQLSAAHLPGTEERLVVLGGTAVAGDPGSPATVRPGGQARWRADVPHVYAAPWGDVDGVLFVRCPQPSAPPG